jgi:probable F420-dependent oxidoreductase
VKVRIGVSSGGDDDFASTVDRAEALGIDSMWLSEIVAGPLVDPVVGMAFALSRTTHIKVGTGVMVLPGRQPVLLAKQLATLARLAPGRVLPVFGLQPARPAEHGLFPVPAGRRAAVFDESLVLLRRLLTEPSVTFHGEFFVVDDISIGPLPDKPLDMWLGGQAPAALRRIGRYADGWLASFITPEEARAGRRAIDEAAAEAGRLVDPDHFGVSIGVAFTEPSPALLALARGRRTDVDPALFFPVGWSAARELVERFVEAGLSKFVVRPIGHPGGSEGFLDEFVSELRPLERSA